MTGVDSRGRRTDEGAGVFVDEAKRWVVGVVVKKGGGSSKAGLRNIVAI